MTREEFEAVLAVEGKYIKVIPTIPAGRFHPTYRNKANTWWDAVVWEWVDEYKPSKWMNHMLYGTPIEPADMERVKRSIAAVRNASTNHAAIKHLMWGWEKGKF